MAETARTIGRIWLFRWFSSACFLIGSLLILSIPLPKHGVRWVEVAGAGWLSLPIPTQLTLIGPVIAGVAAIFLFGKEGLLEELRRTIAEPTSNLVWPFSLGLCLLFVTVLHHLSGHLAPNPGTADLAYAATLIWLAAISWCLGAMPSKFWIRWVRQNSRALAASASAGAALYVLASHSAETLLYKLPALIDPLQRETLYLCSYLLRIFSDRVVFNPNSNLIGIGRFSTYVAPECAGWEGIILFFVFYSLYVLLNRHELRFPHVLALLPIGCVAVWVFNIIRITILVLLGAWSESIGIYGFHSVAGWIFFNLIAVGSVIASDRIRLFSKRSRDSGRVSSATIWFNPASPYLLPLLAIVATGMLITAASPILSYPVSIAAGSIVLWRYRKQYNYRWEISWFAILLGLLVFVIWVASASTADLGQREGVRLMSVKPHMLSSAKAAPWLVLRAFGAVVVAPIAEELAFRGYLLRKLIDREFRKVSYNFSYFSFLGSSIIFGLFHERCFAGIVAGMAFAVALYSRKRLSDAIASHSVANGLLTAYVLATRRWALWS